MKLVTYYDNDRDTLQLAQRVTQRSNGECVLQPVTLVPNRPADGKYWRVRPTGSRVVLPKERCVTENATRPFLLAPMDTPAKSARRTLRDEFPQIWEEQERLRFRHN